MYLHELISSFESWEDPFTVCMKVHLQTNRTLGWHNWARRGLVTVSANISCLVERIEKMLSRMDNLLIRSMSALYFYRMSPQKMVCRNVAVFLLRGFELSKHASLHMSFTQNESYWRYMSTPRFSCLLITELAAIGY